MYRFIRLLYFFILSTSMLMPSIVFAHDWQLTLAGQLHKDVLSRETAVVYTTPIGISARLINESYDDFIYGENIRWGFGAGYTFLLKHFTITTGTGLSLAQSPTLENQLSIDGYLKIQYWHFFLESDNLFYQDGLYGKHALAFAWPLTLGSTLLEPMLGVGTYLNTDYTNTLHDISLFFGVRYAF